MTETESEDSGKDVESAIEYAQREEREDRDADLLRERRTVDRIVDALTKHRPGGSDTES